MSEIDASLDPISIIYQSCDPDRPLSATDNRYVGLAAARGEPGEGGWRRQLARDIRRSERAATFLVAGFLGDGKSTELLRLQNVLTTTEPKLAVVYVDSGEYLNAYEYSFTEILLSVIAETGKQLRDKPYEIELRPGYFMQRVEELKRTLLSDVELRELGAGAGDEAFKVSAKIALKARNSDVTRQLLWDALKGDRTTLVDEFRRMINEQARPALRKQGYHDLVIIIDWLEKLVNVPGKRPGDPDLHEGLFLHHAPLFQSFGTHLVMTLPISMVYSSVQEQLTMTYNRPPIAVNAVRVADFLPKDERQTGRNALCELLTKRFEQAPRGSVRFDEVFPDRGLAEELIAFSGGHPRNLLILVRECCSFCDELPITPEAFEAARKKEIQSAGRKVKENWYPWLAAIHRTHRIDNDDEHLEMLRNLCVFAYADGEVLYGVDPAILGLKKMQDALDEYDRNTRRVQTS